MSARVLLVDDDRELSGLLREYLSQEGFIVVQAYDGQEALEQFQSEPVDIMVLDIMMPKTSGIEVLKSIRSQSQLPILMLTARGDDTDRIIGLELGADDYLPKPCNPRELVARLKAILRRSAGTPQTSELEVGVLRLLPGSREAFISGEALSLTSTEFSLLHALMERPGQVVPKRDLYLAALGREPVRFDRAIDMHVSNLRRKILAVVNFANPIETVRGMGYQLKTPLTQVDS